MMGSESAYSGGLLPDGDASSCDTEDGGCWWLRALPW